jgi:hypothetical protein
MMQLPARPDIYVPSVPEKPKTHKVRWIIFGGLGMFIVLVIIGMMVGTKTSDPVISTPTNSGVDTIALDPDWDAATSLANNINDELDAITPNSDVSADLVHLDAVINYGEQMVILFEGTTYPEIGTYWSRALDHIRSARAAEEAGDFDTFSTEMSAAGDDIGQAAETIPG